MYGIINMNFDEFMAKSEAPTPYDFVYDYELETPDEKKVLEFLMDKDPAEYLIEIYEVNEDGEFLVGSDYDTVENFTKRCRK